MKLYTYDHCPYCVRARYALGVKGIDFEHEILLNDDEATPIGLIGAKMVPILRKPDGSHMGESMDIVHFVDGLTGERVFAGATERAALDAWVERYGMVLRQLLFPRWVAAPLDEFATEGARAYFTRKKTETIGDFGEALAKTPAFKAELERGLEELELLMVSERGVHGSLSVDDVDMFGRLRGVTLIQGVSIPAKVRGYIDHHAELGGVPLYDAMAR